MIILNNINYRYHAQEGKNGVRDIDLKIETGEFVVLCGRSGCGKTTVTRLINGLIPHFYEGELQGEVLVDDLNVTVSGLSSTAAVIGSVFQNPSSQFFNMDTTAELAFGCENQAMEREEIRSRIEKTIEALSLGHLTDRNIFELSGGEKQQIACGSVYAAGPKVYVLDEPSSNMDVHAIRRLKTILAKLKQEGCTIIVSEHRLHYLMDLADRFLYMEDGYILKEYSASDLSSFSFDILAGLGLRTPDLNRVNDRVDKEIMESIKSDPVLELEHFSVFRGKKKLLYVDELKVPAGATIAVIGENGVGKTSFVQALSGLIKSKGFMRVNGKQVGRKERLKLSFMVMQDVNNQLFCESVEEEVGLNLGNESKEKVEEILGKLDLLSYKDRHPAAMSGGQKQRTAIASAICAGKKIIYYDEPTSGLDFDGMQRFCTLISETKKDQLIRFVITHDLELIMGCCTHVLMLSEDRKYSFYPLDEIGVEKVKKYFVRSFQ